MNTTEIEKRLEIAKLATKQASKVLLKYFRANTKISTKDTSYNIVTQADIESEKIIIETIKKNFPQDFILAEESADKIELKPNTWIVDPLDGTNNFAHGISQFAISIAFCHENETILGLVYNPISEEFFEAVKGKGARLNQKSIKVSTNKSIDQCVIGTGFYYDRGPMMKNTLNAIEELFQNNIHGIRRFGAASLDLCFIASARFDAYFEFKLAPWDYAAGALILKEAGGMTSNIKGEPLNLDFSSILASNGLIQKEMASIIKKHFTLL